MSACVVAVVSGEVRPYLLVFSVDDFSYKNFNEDEEVGEEEVRLRRRRLTEDVADEAQQARYDILPL